jgi:hypothetical protein
VNKMVVAATFVFALITPALAQKATVQVTNQSKWEIHNLFLSATEQNDWGPDHLGEYIITAYGGTFTLKSIPCDSYDVDIVDEDGDECIIEAVDMCGDNSFWTITDTNLLACEGEE